MNKVCEICGIAFECSGTCQPPGREIPDWEDKECVCKNCSMSAEYSGYQWHRDTMVKLEIKRKLCFGTKEEITALLMTL